MFIFVFDRNISPHNRNQLGLGAYMSHCNLASMTRRRDPPPPHTKPSKLYLAEITIISPGPLPRGQGSPCSRFWSPNPPLGGCNRPAVWRAARTGLRRGRFLRPSHRRPGCIALNDSCTTTARPPAAPHGRGCGVNRAAALSSLFWAGVLISMLAFFSCR